MMFWLGRHGLGLLGLGWMVGRGLLALLFWGALIALIVIALRSRHADRTPPPAGNAALDILNARYARGEISKEEYDRIRHDIA